MVKFWMLTLRIGRKAIGRTTHNASSRPKLLATKYQKPHVRFKDLQLLGGTAAFQNEQVCDTTLMIFLWQYCSRKTSNFVQWNPITTSPLSTSLLLLICSRKSFLGCTVVSAPNGPQSQVPPDHMGEAWAKGASGSVSWEANSSPNKHAFNETVLKTHLSRRQVIKNRTATGYHNWNPSKIEVYRVVSHCPQRFHCTLKMVLVFQKTSPRTPTAKDLR